MLRRFESFPAHQFKMQDTKLKRILGLLKKEVLGCYKDNLVTLCLFGSFARGTHVLSSDVDILIICENLKRKRLSRVKDFEKIEENLAKKGYKFTFSPLIKTKEEVLMGSPLFFDMIDYSLILYDQDNFFKNYLRILRERLERLGAKKIERKDYWLWVLKKDFRPQEIFSI